MVEEKVKFIITTDWQGGSAISAAIGDLNAFEKKTESVGKTTTQLQAGLRAFSWTTFTQGALNASTAIAQLYTSVSNLNRVQYLVKQLLVLLNIELD